MKLRWQLEGGPFKWGGRSWEDAASKAKIGDHFLDAEVLWPRALSKCSAQRVKATKHTWESHNSGQPAVTAVLRWDCKHRSLAPLEAKRGEARPLPSVGLPSLNSKSPAVQAEQGQHRTTEHFPTSDWREARAFFPTRSPPQASELLKEEPLSSVGEGGDDLWQVHRKQTHGKK